MFSDCSEDGNKGQNSWDSSQGQDAHSRAGSVDSRGAFMMECQEHGMTAEESELGRSGFVSQHSESPSVDNTNDAHVQDISLEPTQMQLVDGSDPYMLVLDKAQHRRSGGMGGRAEQQGREQMQEDKALFWSVHRVLSWMDRVCTEGFEEEVAAYLREVFKAEQVIYGEVGTFFLVAYRENVACSTT